MSDSIKKWHEMQEDKKATRSIYPGDIYIYESPDNGTTVTKRPFGGDIDQREVIKSPHLDKDLKKEAYTILSIYSEESIRLASKILDIGE